jgi:hypothetical protein
VCFDCSDSPHNLTTVVDQAKEGGPCRRHRSSSADRIQYVKAGSTVFGEHIAGLMASAIRRGPALKAHLDLKAQETMKTYKAAIVSDQTAAQRSCSMTSGSCHFNTYVFLIVHFTY